MARWVPLWRRRRREANNTWGSVCFGNVTICRCIAVLVREIECTQKENEKQTNNQKQKKTKDKSKAEGATVWQEPRQAHTPEYCARALSHCAVCDAKWNNLKGTRKRKQTNKWIDPIIVATSRGFSSLSREWAAKRVVRGESNVVALMQRTVCLCLCGTIAEGLLLPYGR